jgi:hypothetical protein
LAHSLNTGLLHQPFNPLAADTNARIGEIGIDAWRALGVLRRLVELDNLVGQCFLVDLTPGRRPISICMETGS